MLPHPLASLMRAGASKTSNRPHCRAGGFASAVQVAASGGIALSGFRDAGPTAAAAFYQGHRYPRTAARRESLFHLGLRSRRSLSKKLGAGDLQNTGAMTRAMKRAVATCAWLRMLLNLYRLYSNTQGGENGGRSPLRCVVVRRSDLQTAGGAPTSRALLGCLVLEVCDHKLLTWGQS